MMKWLDLFSGCGMYALGLEQAGHEVIGFCEVDKFCHKLLKKHWPMKPISWDIKFLNKVLTELLEASPAKIYQSPGGVRGYNGTPPERPQQDQDSSGRWLTPFAWFDLNTGSWKTWQQSLIEGWETYSGPWPPSGIMRNGIAWGREPLAHPIIAPEHTFLPTITASEGKGSSRKRYVGSPILTAGKMSVGLRNCEADGIYLDPTLAERAMGLPIDFTLLETETLPALSGNLQKDL